MTQIATVEECLRPGIVRVVVRRETACGHDCENCGGCGAAGGQIFRVEALDPIGVFPGDRVVVESSTRQVLAAAVLVYFIPMLTLLLGYGAGEWLGGGAILFLAAGIGFLIGLLPAVWMDRSVRRRRQSAFRILEKL